jgi:hypothetical protein
MKTQLADLLNKLKPLFGYLKTYAVFIFFLIFLGLLGFLVFRINQYARVEPSEDAIQDKLKAVQRPKVDQAVLDKIQQLQAQNVEVNSLFDKARSNPFNE